MKLPNSNLLAKGPRTGWSDSRTKDELWMASASELNALLTHNNVSPVEITESILARIEEIDSKLNAFCHIAADSARQAARESEARTRKNARLSPLDGIPVHIKDNVFVAGMPCTWGSLLFKDHVPDMDDPPVAKLRASGAVLIGKTNTPEFALMGKTENTLFGVTRNPWDLSLTPGGSSGGAAAAVAAGMGPLALATDSGGSIRRPASYCGVVGLKTSLGKVARGMGFPATVYDFQTIGPIARDATDAELLFDAITASQKTGGFAQLEASVITVLDDESLGIVEPDVVRCLKAVAAMLSELGHTVNTGAAPWRIEEIESLWQFFSSVGAARISKSFDPKTWASKATQQVQELALKGQHHSAVQYAEQLDELRKLRYQAEHEWFGTTQFILTPTAPTPAWPLGNPYPKTIAGKEVGPRACSVFAPVVNAAGLPALNMPASLSDDGLPIGIQLIGPRGADEILLKLGHQLGEKLKNKNPEN